MTLRQAIKDPSWLLERMSNQKVEGNDGPGFRHVRCPKMLWEELVRLVEGLKVEEGREPLAQSTELKIRMFLWLGHGHQGQYGDDGEMQCGECARFGIIDYKREPLDKVAETARIASLDSGLKALRAAQHLKREQELSPFAVSGGAPPGTVTGWETPLSVGFTFDEAAALARYQVGHHASRDNCQCQPCQWARIVLQREQEPARCNRCQANLCEHDNCTDWTCARACSKCAKGPREQERAPAAQPPQELVSLHEALKWALNHVVRTDEASEEEDAEWWKNYKAARAALTRGAVGGGDG